jgi:hypothetical protein
MMKVYSRRQLMLEMGKPYDAEVEYLGSTGTQYIDTGIKAAGNLHVKTYLIDYFKTENFGAWPFGGRNGYLNKAVGIFISRDDKKLHQPYGNKEYVRDAYSVYPQSCWVEMQGGTLKVDTHTYTASSQSFISDYNLILFGLQNRDTTIKYSVKMGAAFVSNGDVTLDLIPVRKGTTGYMYDKVSGQLFGNSGTGNFILGPDKH